MAPMAPEPLTPDESTPAKLITVSEEVTPWFNEAVTETLLKATGEKARQISAVPLCASVRATRTQVNPPPETLFTDVLVCPFLEPAAIKASINSLPAAVENAGEVTEKFAFP